MVVAYLNLLSQCLFTEIKLQSTYPNPGYRLQSRTSQTEIRHANHWNDCQ